MFPALPTVHMQAIDRTQAVRVAQFHNLQSRSRQYAYLHMHASSSADNLPSSVHPTRSGHLFLIINFAFLANFFHPSVLSIAREPPRRPEHGRPVNTLGASCKAKNYYAIQKSGRTWSYPGGSTELLVVKRA